MTVFVVIGLLITWLITWLIGYQMKWVIPLVSYYARAIRRKRKRIRHRNRTSSARGREFSGE